MATTDTAISLPRFIARHGIRGDFEWDNNPTIDSDWDASARHYRYTIRCGRRRMTVPYHQGSGISHDPRLSDVLDCLAMDANGIENSRSFEEWADDYGYDPDSRKAHTIYSTIRKQAQRLERLLGKDAYEQLLYHTERL